MKWNQIKFTLFLLLLLLLLWCELMRRHSEIHDYSLTHMGEKCGLLLLSLVLGIDKSFPGLSAVNKHSSIHFVFEDFWLLSLELSCQILMVTIFADSLPHLNTFSINQWTSFISFNWLKCEYCWLNKKLTGNN